MALHLPKIASCVMVAPSQYHACNDAGRHELRMGLLACCVCWFEGQADLADDMTLLEACGSKADLMSIIAAMRLCILLCGALQRYMVGVSSKSIFCLSAFLL